MPTLTTRVETWPLEGAFVISRGRTTEKEVVVAEIADGPLRGQGECSPTRRYGESVESVRTQIEAMAPRIAGGLTREALQQAMPPGAARNALDCALWDLESRRRGQSVASLAGVAEAPEIVTAYTISLGVPETMAAQAKRHADRPLLKIKLGGGGDDERVAAVREAAPNARLIVDANEAWSLDHMRRFPPALAGLGVELIEQPLPSGADADLVGIDSPIPVCADESFHHRSHIPRLKDLYQAVNIKLDKTGGLTEALACLDAARQANLKILVGCMVATSLAMAPARLVAGAADWVDLDGPLLLAQDRTPGLTYTCGRIAPVPPGLWGYTEYVESAVHT